MKRPAGLPPEACSVRSAAIAEPMIATAPPTARWLLLEVPRAWPDKILKSPELSGWVSALNSVVESRSGRVLFIRRPGRVPERIERAYVVIDAATRTEASGTWHPGSVELRADLAEAVAHFEATTPLPHPAQTRLLVCAHGQHDQCCAVRGRPVAALLADRWSQEVWECSHLGGDRFGANVLVLPDGTYFGRLDSENAVDVLANHLAGETDPRFLRGVTTQDPRVQAAATEVLSRLGRATAYDLSGSVLPGPEAGSVIVTVRGHPAAAAVEVLVTRRVLPPARRACLATEDKVAVTYDVRLLD